MKHKLTSELPTWLDAICQRRRGCGSRVTEFKYNKARLRMLKGPELFPNEPVSSGPVSDQGILYWMNRDQRVQDNWAFLYAERLAFKFNAPLHTCFCLAPRFQADTLRHFTFMVDGLAEVEQECRKLKIAFHLLDARDVLDPKPKTGSKRKRSETETTNDNVAAAVASAIEALVRKLNIACVITDLTPLREPASWISKLVQVLPKDVSVYQVDAHNVVPIWAASDKLEYAARTIRPKIHSKLSSFLTEFPPLVGNHPGYKEGAIQHIDWKKIVSTFNGDRTVEPVDWARGGSSHGLRMLWDFINNRLPIFDKSRNDPTKPALSGLSPWFHFGQLAPQRAILEVQAMRHLHKAPVEIFIEEALVRRELADNFCFYNPKYDAIEGAYAWAQETLSKHANDKRDPVYGDDQFEAAKTHDPLWNASQRQLTRTGKLHGFLRMYWAKKILEWHDGGPTAALKLALYLNDRYSLDGSDPNGVVGVMWSICGIHDQGWGERPVYGKIRCMTYKGCQGKFPVSKFEATYTQ